MSNKNVIDFDEYKYINTPKYKSDELLEEALDATSKSKAIKLAKQALEIYPDNIDAEGLLAEFEENIIKRLKKYDIILEKATKLLEEQNMFDEESVGCFWGILETRPYMRIRYNRLLLLKTLGRYTEVAKECEELLKLCNSDNLGVRYILMGVYCILEKFEECKKLYDKYSDCSAFMTFPMAIMYFKKGDYKKAKQYLRETEEENPFILDFLLEENGRYIDEIEDEYYSYGSEEEAFFIIRDFIYLVGSVPMFLDFINNEYRK